MQANRGNLSAVVAGLLAGVGFGIFWMPLRAIGDAGVSAVWSTSLILLVPTFCCLPVIWVNRHHYWPLSRGLLGGAMTGLALALYSSAFLYTEVIRVVLLFYLMPIWGFFLGRILLGEAVTWYRWFAVLSGLTGMVIIFSGDGGIPLPSNLGDWLALISGMAWSAGSIFMLLDRPVRPAFHMVQFFGVAAILCTGVAIGVTLSGDATWPGIADLGGILIWLVPLSAFFLLPVGYATVFAPTRLNPGVVGLLFMFEVAVAAITAAIWAGEPISAREWTGLALVMGAGLIEPLVIIRQFRQQSRKGASA
ncbi:MAG: DMT family transporter [Pseudomonadota bacterium]